MITVEGKGCVIEIGDVIHINPALRNGQCELRLSVTHRQGRLEHRLRVGQPLCRQICPGDAGMRLAAGEHARDRGRLDQQQLYAGETFKAGRIAARGGCGGRMSGILEACFGRCPKATLGRNGKDQRHASASVQARIRPVQTATPMAGTAPPSARGSRS